MVFAFPAIEELDELSEELYHHHQVRIRIDQTLLDLSLTSSLLKGAILMVPKEGNA